MQPLSLEYKLHHLREIFAAMDSVLVAYSGGIDSTVVLKSLTINSEIPPWV